jgi:hypothetical protein
MDFELNNYSERKGKNIMSTSSILIESKDYSEHKQAEEKRVILPFRLPMKNNKFEAIKLRIYRHFIETVKSSVFVFACLALYKISGLHALWIQFVHKILIAP